MKSTRIKPICFGKRAFANRRHQTFSRRAIEILHICPFESLPRHLSFALECEDECWPLHWRRGQAPLSLPADFESLSSLVRAKHYRRRSNTRPKQHSRRSLPPQSDRLACVKLEEWILLCLQPARLSSRTRKLLRVVWGVDAVNVKTVESGEIVRFTYRALDPEKAKALNDKKAEPF